ncbi:MAG: hypothetical protein R3284_06390 [Rubricoccaceae bacterium]|nr:hypothetical protein [Rubricoccaceae bacterium]
MTAIVAVEFEPDSSTAVALHALRFPGLTIRSLDVSARDAVANVEVVDIEVLNAALEAICRCTCIRSGAAFPSES